jgi:hypothetical protein
VTDNILTDKLRAITGPHRIVGTVQEAAAEIEALRAQVEAAEREAAFNLREWGETEKERDRLRDALTRISVSGVTVSDLVAVKELAREAITRVAEPTDERMGISTFDVPASVFGGGGSAGDPAKEEADRLDWKEQELRGDV